MTKQLYVAITTFALAVVGLALACVFFSAVFVFFGMPKVYAPWAATALVLGAWITVYLPFATLIIYWALMNADKVREEGKLDPWTERIVDDYILPWGLTHDIAFNVFSLTVFFGDIPQEWLATSRLDRYVAGTNSERAATATMLRGKFLNYFDRRGIHHA